jgi:Derlin-2/3
MADAIAGGGMVGQFPLEQWFYEMPVCTRWWMTAALSASLLVQCHIVSPFQLFYSFRTVFVRSQVGRPRMYSCSSTHIDHRRSTGA